MKLYHGSSIRGLTQLHPSLSEHGRPYLYLSSDIVVAGFYTVWRVERPYSWFPYGFSDGVPIYTEYYKNALADVYRGRQGYIYHCSPAGTLENPTGIEQVLVSEQPVDVAGVLEIADMYRWLLEQEQAGALLIRRYEALTEREIVRAERLVADEIRAHRLKEAPQSRYARFLAEKFPQIWAQPERREETML